MNERRDPTLFQQVLGAAFYGVGAAVRRLHAIRGEGRVAGVASIERGTGWLARRCATLLRLPQPINDASTTLHVLASGASESWRLVIGGHPVEAVLQCRGELLQVRLPRLRLQCFPHVRDGAMWWQIVDVRLFGWLPLPAKLFDGVVYREREWQGRYEFLIDAVVPVAGRVFRCEGWLASAAEFHH